MMKKCQCGGSKLAQLLLVVGGLNWGLVGVGMFIGKNLNLVNLALGKWSMAVAAVYVVVGICTIVSLMGCKCSKCKTCNAGAAAPKM